MFVCVDFVHFIFFPLVGECEVLVLILYISFLLLFPL